jgi:divinyl protochlorophyllide a 8-vinyl-reductase
MVDEVEVNRLVHALATDLDPALFETVLRDAGRRTAEYLMTHRIPRLAQRLMRALPSALALRVLLAGIMGHTWTFAGTASVKIAHSRGRPLELTMRGCPMCRGLHVRAPTCHFYAATLERLLVALVSPVARVIEVRCEGAGDTSCAFALALR